MSDRVCVRGCKQRGVHYATCAWFGIKAGVVPYMAFCSPGAPGERCTGCAEKPARDEALVCDTCFYRLRTLVRDADDLMGRLQSLADPMKATPTDKAPGGRAQQVEPPAPVDADLLDALNDIVHTLRDWDRFVDPRTLEGALPDLVNNVEHVRVLGFGFLDRHPLVDGVRDFWSVQDAVDKWGVERRVKGPDVWLPDTDGELATFPIPEWGDPLLNRDEAEQFVGSARTLQRWRKKDLIEPVGQIYIAGVLTVLYRMSDLARVRGDMKMKIGRPRTAPGENGGEAK